jgi:antitoxin YobK
MRDYEEAVALVERQGGGDFAGPRPAELIAAAEQALGFRFPPTYRRFLSDHGAGSVGGTEIYGVIDENFADSMIPDGVWYNLELRREGHPGALYVFYAVGDGEHFCLDSERVAADGEMPIVGVSLGDESDREEIAPDFGRAFLMLVEEEFDLESER